jgi:mRNA degradation ribonuclease J1/J2
MKKQIKKSLRTFIQEKTKKKPMIVPILIEV